MVSLQCAFSGDLTEDVSEKKKCHNKYIDRVSLQDEITGVLSEHIHEQSMHYNDYIEMISEDQDFVTAF